MILSREKEIQLIKNIKSHKIKAENQLIQKYRNFFRSIIRKKIVNKTTCDDILNDTFMSAIKYTKSCRYDGKRARIQTYLTKIIRNQICHYFKGEKKAAEVPLEIEPFTESNPLDELIREETLEYLKSAIVKLNPKNREIIKLKYYEEKSYKEISRIMNIPQGTVGSRLHSSAKKLKDIFFSMYEEKSTIKSKGFI